MPITPEQTDAKARESELVKALHAAQQDYEWAWFDRSAGYPADREEGEQRAADADDLGERLAEALWLYGRASGPDAMDVLAMASEAIDDDRCAIITASGHLWLHRKRHERTFRQARCRSPHPGATGMSGGHTEGPPKLCVMGGIDHIFALGIERRGVIARIPGTGTNDYRLARAWLREATAALSKPNERRA